MSTAKKSLIFLAITFAFSWGACWLGYLPGPVRDLLYWMGVILVPRDPGAIANFITLVTMMVGPAIGALVCTFAFEKGHRIDALGLRFRVNLWWLYAWLIPLAICAAALGFTLLSGRHLVDPAQGVLAMAQGKVPAEKLAQLRQLLPILDELMFIQVLIGTLINAVAITFTEELGWRGYLHFLWRPSGFWRASLATGAIWGVWHAPAIYLYGLNYPDHRLIGIPIFIVFCTLLAPVMTLIRDRAGATWATGLAHGTINATAGLVSLAVSDPAFPWNGLVGIGGLAALGLAFALLLLSKPHKFPL